MAISYLAQLGIKSIFEEYKEYKVYKVSKNEVLEATITYILPT